MTDGANDGTLSPEGRDEGPQDYDPADCAKHKHGPRDGTVRCEECGRWRYPGRDEGLREQIVQDIASALRLAATSGRLPPSREPLPFLSLARVSAAVVSPALAQRDAQWERSRGDLADEFARLRAALAQRDRVIAAVSDVAAMLREFHEAFGIPIRSVPVARPPEVDLRKDLLAEEVDEYLTAVDANDVTEVADALADIVYVAFGSALAHGINLPAVLTEVHRSNMSKLGADGKPVLRDDGKVIKGPGYFRPDLRAALASGDGTGEQ